MSGPQVRQRRTISLGMSAACRPDQPNRSSRRVWARPLVTERPRVRPAHRARNGHSGLLLPKPSQWADTLGKPVSNLRVAFADILQRVRAGDAIVTQLVTQRSGVRVIRSLVDRQGGPNDSEPAAGCR
jgi:hypothetical protein